LQGFKILDVPEAGRWIARGVFKPIPGMCDWIVIDQDGRSAFIDTKSLGNVNYPYSMIDPNQLKQLRAVGDRCPAGYVVYFRPVNKVYFLDWRILSGCRQGESIKMEDGVELGPITNFRVKKIFSCQETNILFPS